MCMQTPWEKTLDFHGHVCPGLVLGFRAAEAGLRALGIEAADGAGLVAVVENDACGVDAVQVVTGCTAGKGNLILRDWGKQVYTFIRRDTGAAVRVAVRYGALTPAPDILALQEKAAGEGLSAEEERMLARLRESAADRLLEMPEEELLDIRTVRIECPPRARIRATVQCAWCGEGVMETRAKVYGGRLICPACFSETQA